RKGKRSDQLSWQRRHDLSQRRSHINRRRVCGRFMGRPLPFLRMHWDHEPDWHTLSLPSPHKAGRGWPAGRERGGSWAASTTSQSRIRTMNLPPHPPSGTLSPLGWGEGGVRGGSWVGLPLGRPENRSEERRVGKAC